MLQLKEEVEALSSVHHKKSFCSYYFLSFFHS